jgi:hypothetical protein
MTAYLGQVTANSGSSLVPSESFTVPSYVTTGTACFLLFQAYSQSYGMSAMTVTSTGDTWINLGTQHATGTLSQNNASLWYMGAGPAEAGSTVTVHSSVSLYINVTAVFYSGAAPAVIDVWNVYLQQALAATIGVNTQTTDNDGDWALYFAAICNGSTAFTGRGHQRAGRAGGHRHRRIRGAFHPVRVRERRHLDRRARHASHGGSGRRVRRHPAARA